jgi:hypothetical protein
MPQLTLTPADQELFNVVAHFQGCIGPDSPDIVRAFGSLRNCVFSGAWYDKATNPTLKGYVDAMCSALVPVTTNFGTNFCGLFIMFNWGQQVAGLNSTSIGNFTIGSAGSFSGPAEWKAGLAKPPGLTVSFRAGALILQSDQNDDSSGTDGNSIRNYENGWLGKWTTYKDAAKALTPVWTAQARDLKTISNKQALDDQGCLFLLHLLIALCNSPNPDDRDTVATIAALHDPKKDPPDPPDLTDPQPHKPLIDRLIYFAMLTWNDALGSYAWNRDQVAARIADFGAALRNPDPGSSAITKVLANETKLLQAYPSYPSVDPEAPSLGMTERRTRTLEKINELWTAYVPSS